MRAGVRASIRKGIGAGVAAILGTLLLGLSAPGGADVQAGEAVFFAQQGADWTHARRQHFYTQDQGSRMIPLSWLRALRRPDGAAFLGDALSRYGYLHNPQAPHPDLPVGFTVAPRKGRETVGMTCAACHTREIKVEGARLRIDGGPAIVDFQAFLRDLDAAAGRVARKVDGGNPAFDAFAGRVLGAPPDPAAKAKLRRDLTHWYTRFHAWVDGSLPTPGWGPGRLDAISMIFNRLTGLDLGPPPDFLIEENIERADAPTRYPFLWNAARQDQTQWPGFALNGNDLLGLARNLGEVYGVFAAFRPVKEQGWFKLNRNYIKHNSANFEGLGELEDLIKKIGPPAWPWPLDRKLAAKGQRVFERETANGGCAECHQVRPGDMRLPNLNTWKTPVQDVGTDCAEHAVLNRTVADAGILDGARIPFLTGGAIGEAAKGKNKAACAKDGKDGICVVELLNTAVVGAIVQHKLGFLATDKSGNGSELLSSSAFAEDLKELKDLYKIPSAQKESKRRAGASGTDQNLPPSCAYESRVLDGIWAAAPYLHNGSVPTLHDLLKPVAERPTSFKLGPAYDIDKVGLAAEQTRFDHTLHTTGCDDRMSGNSRCGHDYGTDLSKKEKAALIEYLKSI